MLGIFKKWFSKNDEDMAMRLPKAEQAKFILTVDNIEARIPGLKQPAIKEILEKESIDKENEAALLVRFGRKTIANPYELYLNS